MTKIISFSLWGHDRGYVLGALANAKLAPVLFPDWICRFYCAEDVPQKVLADLKALGCEIVMKKVTMGYRGLFWRMEVADDPTVERFIVRDTDSRLTPRDAVMVNEWEVSGEWAHIIRDSESHGAWMLGATWGLINGKLPPFRDLLEDFWEDWEEGKSEYNSFASKKGRMYGVDQTFLSAQIFPLIKDHHIAHVADYPQLKFTGKEKLVPPIDRKPGQTNLEAEPYIGMVCNLEKEWDDYVY
jgi:hypothetical protein